MPHPEGVVATSVRGLNPALIIFLPEPAASCKPREIWAARSICTVHGSASWKAEAFSVSPGCCCWEESCSRLCRPCSPVQRANQHLLPAAGPAGPAQSREAHLPLGAAPGANGASSATGRRGAALPPFAPSSSGRCRGARPAAQRRAPPHDGGAGRGGAALRGEAPRIAAGRGPLRPNPALLPPASPPPAPGSRHPLAAASAPPANELPPPPAVGSVRRRPFTAGEAGAGFAPLHLPPPRPPGLPSRSGAAGRRLRAPGAREDVGRPRPRCSPASGPGGAPCAGAAPCIAFF